MMKTNKNNRHHDHHHHHHHSIASISSRNYSEQQQQQQQQQQLEEHRQQSRQQQQQQQRQRRLFTITATTLFMAMALLFVSGFQLYKNSMLLFRSFRLHHYNSEDSFLMTTAAATTTTTTTATTTAIINNNNTTPTTTTTATTIAALSDDSRGSNKTVATQQSKLLQENHKAKQKPQEQQLMLQHHAAAITSNRSNNSKSSNNRSISHRNQGRSSSLLLLEELTSQYLPRRNRSRNLCGYYSMIPKHDGSTAAASPADDDDRQSRRRGFPRVLSSDDDDELNVTTATSTSTTNKQFCRPNAIVYLAQKGLHSTYNGRNSTALLLKSLDLLYKNYLSIDRHYDNCDVLIFHASNSDDDDDDDEDEENDYHETAKKKNANAATNPFKEDDNDTNTSTTTTTSTFSRDDLQMLQARYQYKVHFKLIDLSHTDYWTVPEHLRHDNKSNWTRWPQYSMGYRHMIRWYALKLYDFVRDYANQQQQQQHGGGGGCSYQYIMRLDEDSYLHSPIHYDLFDFMHSNNYSYGFRMCSYEMETQVWSDYVDHVQYCGGSSVNDGDGGSGGSHVGPQQHKKKKNKTNAIHNKNRIVPHRQIQLNMCAFYSNFFILNIAVMFQPQVQHFLHWIDRLGIMYRERYGDMNVQALAIYAFVPPFQIHRFLDWTYEHMTHSARCPMWGALQQGYNDPDYESAFRQFRERPNMIRYKRCPLRKKSLSEESLSPTYAHMMPPANDPWWNDTFGVERHQVRFHTYAAGAVELPYRILDSG